VKIKWLSRGARTLLACLFLPALCAPALENGLARTPPMGWNSWNTFAININEQLIRATADAMVDSGMKSAGYEYVIIDAGWKAQKRAADGQLVANPQKFPSGIKALADYVHSRGLKLGIYTDAGTEDCDGGGPGSRNHEEIDAATFAAWGVDYVKEDWCKSEGLDGKTSYSKMSAALRATGRPIVFSMCEWGDNHPWLWAAGVANLWRTTGDNKNCWDCGRKSMNQPGGYPRGWTLILDRQPALQQYAGAGHWNDPDMLEVGQPGLSIAESQAHFSLWAILAAPLIAGNDLRSMPQEIAAILSNKEVISVDQDAKGIEGTLVKTEGALEVWARPLADGSQAVVLFNRSTARVPITVEWPDLHWTSGRKATVRDLLNHRDLGSERRRHTALVVSHGVVMLRLTPTAK
jgi:alpha-galactosidase